MPALLEAPPSCQPVYRSRPAYAPVPAVWRTLPAVSLTILASLFTLINCVKPLQVDDAAYLLYAAQIAEDPTAPYGFDIYWGYQYQPANSVIAPPVFLYWLAAARVMIGDNVFLLKLSLLPWHALLVFTLFALLRRWTGALCLPLTWMAVLSPAWLPSSNLMLDIPAVTLGLAALWLFITAIEQNSVRLSILAGVVASLAMQTKYSAFVTPLVLLAYGLTHANWRHALLAVLTAAIVFVSWEIFVACRHGESHFLLAAQQRTESLVSRVGRLSLPTLTLTAALAPGVLFIATLGSLHARRWLMAAVFAAVSGFLLLGLIPTSVNEWRFDPGSPKPTLQVDGLLYGCWTTFWWTALAVSLWRRPRGSSSRLLLFLLFWQALEIGGCVVLSPFAAARRVLGVTIAATFVIGFLIAQRPPPKRLTWAAVCASIALGCAVAFIDGKEAGATKELADGVARIASQENRDGRVWFSGAWAFQYYAMRAGLTPISPEYSELRSGDLLILTEQQLNRIDFRPDDQPLKKLQVMTLEDDWPWQTLGCFYCGATPVRHHEGPRLRLTVYRVEANFIARGHGTLPGVR